MNRTGDQDDHAVPHGAGDVIDAERILHALRQMSPHEVVEPGVTAGDALAVMTTPSTPDGAVYEPAQVYGRAGAGGRELSMHLYPRADRAQRRPGVLLIHGGGFQEGFPEMQIRNANQLAERGYVTASIRYRLSGEAPWPAALEDAKCAVRWLRANADTIGLDPDAVAVGGNSAGGNLAAMVASTPGRFEGSGGNADVSSAAAAAVLWYPGLDLRPSRSIPLVRELVAKWFGTTAVTDDMAMAASPIAYVEAASPTLTFCGTADPIVPVSHVRAYHAALDSVGVPNEVRLFEGLGHSFDYNVARWDECFETMVKFLSAHVG